MFGLRSHHVSHDPGDLRIAPAVLPLPLDTALFRHHFEGLLDMMERTGGADAHLAALSAKRRHVEWFFSELASGAAGEGALESVLAMMFTARRRLFPALCGLGTDSVIGALGDLREGRTDPSAALQAFVDRMPGAADSNRQSIRQSAKLRRAAWDFAAELLHFSDPEGMPLMTRWVWDQGTQSGALREFIRGNDSLREVPFTNDPGLFEGARHWLNEQLRGEGVYRDLPLWVDLVLAQAYLGYFRSMTEGSLGADFGRGVPPHEQLRRLLGIDAEPGTRHERVKKTFGSAQSGTH